MRSVIKALSWRAFAAIDTAVAATVVMFLRTGHINTHSVFALVGGIVGMELVTKTLLFTMHERLWERRTVLNDRAPAKVAPTPTWEQITNQMCRDYATKRGEAAE